MHISHRHSQTWLSLTPSLTSSAHSTHWPHSPHSLTHSSTHSTPFHSAPLHSLHSLTHSLTSLTDSASQSLLTHSLTHSRPQSLTLSVSLSLSICLSLSLSLSISLSHSLYLSLSTCILHEHKLPDCYDAIRLLTCSSMSSIALLPAGLAFAGPSRHAGVISRSMWQLAAGFRFRGSLQFFRVLKQDYCK